MTTMKQEGAVPDFLRMDQPVSSDPANARKTGNWHGWPAKDIMSRATDEVGRVQSREPRYKKNFSAIVGYSVTVA